MQKSTSPTPSTTHEPTMTDGVPVDIPQELIDAYEEVLVKRDALTAEHEELARLRRQVEAELELIQRDRAAAQSRSFVEQIVQQTLRRQQTK
jgi:hypothetical protein